MRTIWQLRVMQLVLVTSSLSVSVSRSSPELCVRYLVNPEFYLGLLKCIHCSLHYRQLVKKRKVIRQLFIFPSKCKIGSCARLNTLVKYNVILPLKFRSGQHTFSHYYSTDNNVYPIRLVVCVQHHMNEIKLLQAEVCKLSRCLQIIYLITNSAFLKVIYRLPIDIGYSISNK